MGYYANIESANLIIPAARFEAARLELIREQVTGWADESEQGTLQDILVANDFDVDIRDADGALSVEGFDNKFRDHGSIIDILGKYAEDDWFVEWAGEDHDRWRQSGAGTQTMIHVAHDDLYRLQIENRKMRALLAKGVFHDKNDAAEVEAIL